MSENEGVDFIQELKKQKSRISELKSLNTNHHNLDEANASKDSNFNLVHDITDAVLEIYGDQENLIDRVPEFVQKYFSVETTPETSGEDSVLDKELEEVKHLDGLLNDLDEKFRLINSKKNQTKNPPDSTENKKATISEHSFKTSKFGSREFSMQSSPPKTSGEHEQTTLVLSGEDNCYFDPFLENRLKEIDQQILKIVPEKEWDEKVSPNLLHSKRVYFYIFPTRNECIFTSPLSETFRNECSFTSSPPETSVVLKGLSSHFSGSVRDEILSSRVSKTVNSKKTKTTLKTSVVFPGDQVLKDFYDDRKNK